jgi:TP901 family phage tail tape measure protein
MAKIRNTDVSEKDVFANFRKSAEKSIAVLKEMEKVLKVNLTQQKEFSKGFKATNVSDIKKLATAQNEVKKSVQGLNEVEKQKLRLEKQLAVANSTKASDLAQLKLLTQEQLKNVKAEAKAELERLGVIKNEVALRKKAAEEKKRIAAEEKRIILENKKLEKDQARQQKETDKQLAASRKAAAKENAILANAYKSLTRDTNKAQAEFKRLAAQFGVNSKEAKNARNSFEKLDTKLRTVNDAARDGRRDVGRYGTAFSKLGGILKSGLGFLGITAGIAGITRLIGGAVNIFKDFEQANSKLQSVLGATSDEMDKLKVQAKELGSVTSFTASAVTELQTEFAKLGFPTSDILNMTESTLDAAAAMGSGLGEQAALTGATIKAFGLSSKDAARVNDVLAKSTSRSALDFSKLNASMSTIAPVASKLGFGLEDTVALLGNLSDSGFDASTAATATRNIMLKLADSSSVLGKRLKEPVRDLPSLVKGLNQLKNEGVDLSEALELTDVRSVAAFSTFLSGTDSLEKLSSELNNANGAAKEMADTMLDNLAGDTVKAQSAIEGLVLSLEDGTGALNGFFRSVVQGFTEFIGILTVTDTAIEKSIASLEKEQDTLTDLQIEINTTNVNSQRRIEIMQELKDNYPELLGLIDAETASNEDLQEAIDKVNESVRTRLLLQEASRASERLQNSTDKLKQANENTLNDLLIRGTNLMIERGKADLLRGKSAKEQLEIIKEEAGFFSFLSQDIQRYLGDVNLQNSLQKTTNNEREKSIKLINNLLKNNGDLNELTTQELRNLVKTGVLTDKKLNQQAREIIIQRELSLAKKEETEIINENTDSTSDNNKSKDKKVSILKELITKTRALTNAEKEAAEQERKRREEEEDANSFAAKIRKTVGGLTKITDIDKDTTLDREKFLAEERAKIRGKSLDVLNALEEKYFREQNEKADKQLTDAEKREKRLQELADKGIQDASDSLAKNQKDQAEAVKKKEELRQQEKNTELALAVLKAYSAELEKPGATSGSAMAKAIASSAVLVGAISALPAFFDGTEDTGNNGKGVDGKGGFLSVLHPNERVVPKVINDKLDGISNKQLGELADNGLLSYALNSQQMGVKYSQDSGMTKELMKLQDLNKSIIKAIENRPIDEGWKVDDIRKVVTHSVKKGTTRTKTNFKL